MKKTGILMGVILIVAVMSGMAVNVYCSCAVLATDKPLAGISVYIDKYAKAVCDADDSQTPDDMGTDEAELASSNTTVTNNATSSTDDSSNNAATQMGYRRLGVADVTSYLNIHKKPNVNSLVVGKMTKNSGCSIIKIKNGWAKIKSGKVHGWVKSDYLLKDTAAVERAKSVATLRATIVTDTLNVRKLPTTDADICDELSMNEEYTVGKKNITKEWLKNYVSKNCSKKELQNIDMKAMYADVQNWIMLTVDEEKVFISKDFIQFTYNLNRAVKTNTISISSSTSGGDSTLLSSIAKYALKYLGNRYVWGGTSLTNGVDCSGFVMRIYEHFGYTLPRVSRSQAAATTTVDKSDVRVGDLFFYGSNGVVSHVALYIGNGQIIHASNSHDGIKISNAYYRTPIKIGRVIND